jgi:tetratricopeptide (TPR) repeat protein
VAYRRLGDLDRAIEAGERALSVDDVELEVVTTLYLGQALWFTGALRRAVDVFARNVASLTADQIRQRFGAPGYPGVFSMTDMASVLAELGDFAAAKRVGEQGLAIADDLAQPFTLVAAHIAVASAAISMGDFVNAITGLERARSLCERGDLPVQRIAVVARLGYAYVLTGRLADGLALLEEAAAQLDRIDGFWRPRFLGWLAEGYLVGGRVHDAARVAERAQELSPNKMPANQAWMAWLAGEVASHDGRIEQAAGHYRDAAAIADRLELRFLRARCHLSLGRLYRSAGDRRARAELSAAADAFRAMGSGYWLAVTESGLS